MSALWTSADIAKATGGVASVTFEVSGISIDSRTTQPGDLFIPLVADRDGHDFIPMAMEKGAAGCLSDRAVNYPHVRVADTMQALERMGRLARDRSRAKRIAVTGSNGKTSVKDALATMLSRYGKVHKSQKSFNNHLGVPITIATLPANADFAVFETGMNHAGELTALSQQVSPHIAVITNVSGAHKAHFESVEAIAEAKAEIRHGLEAGGTLILNADNAYTPIIRELARGLNVLTFGRQGDVRILDGGIEKNDGGHVRMDVDGSTVSVESPVVAEYWKHNLAACLAVAHTLGLDLDGIGQNLAAVTPSAGRGDVSELALDGKRFQLIDQSYNANPASMRAAIASAGTHPHRKIAVLGDMKELGSDELELHAALAEPLVEAGFARVIFVGECMRALRGALPRQMRAAHCADAREALIALKDELVEGDVVMIKGSNSTGLYGLAKALKAGEG